MTSPGYFISNERRNRPIASFSGSASGTLASIVTGWVTQRRKDRIRHSLRATSQRGERPSSLTILA